MIYFGKKLAQMLPVAFFVTIIVFALTNLLPGDPTVTILGEQATPEQRARAIARLRGYAADFAALARKR